ncbi:MAG: type II secretion system minor pseudopilin GspJ [Gammaproteobacteria bacterium]|nr:type II secretion system minor pseudopilin GspJ [Gammaproteobacteria bacterium]
MRRRGFTLLEMVITVLIFGIVGVLAVQLLSQSISTTEKVIHRSTVLSDWHRAMNIIEQDLLQINDRVIRDELGDYQPSLVVDESGQIEFTRNGWRNILGHQRSEQQRVLYFLYENQMFRRYWDVLDRAQDSEPIDQLLLPNVHSVEFELIDRTGREHYFWPPSSYAGEEESFSPLVAIRVTFDLPQLGTVSHLWLVPVGIGSVLASEAIET